MKNKTYLIFIFVLFLLTACGKKEYVVFDYNCNSLNNYKCELKDKKLNCDVKIPTCGNSKFLGWYDAEERGNKVDLFSNFNDKDVIYAHWESNGEEYSSEEYSSSEYSSSSSEKSPSSFEYSNSSSEYLSSSSSYYSSSEQPSSSSSQPVTKYTITFNANGGSGGQTGSLIVTYNGTLPSISSTKPIKAGYTFMGWFDNADYTKGTQYYTSSNQPTKKYDRKSNLTLYAGWKANAYTIMFDGNGGTGGQTAKLAAVYNETLPPINTNKSTKAGYTFMGWFDNADYTKGTQYYTSSNHSTMKYTKTTNITLYAGWKVNTLSIQYNGNGGTWNNPSKDTYSVNSSGTVIVKSTGKVYEQKLNYGEKLESTGLVDYNGLLFKWKNDEYIVESKKEYYLQNGSIKNTLDQAKVYSAADLAKYSGCDLSKSDCTITVRVNWQKIEDILKDINIIYTGDSRTQAYSYIKPILGFDETKETIYAKYNTGYDDDFKSHLERAKNKINNNNSKTFAVTFNYGVNAPKAYKSFCNYYDNYIKSIDNKQQFYIISITPVYKNPWMDNNDIEIFNKYMQNTCISQIRNNIPNSKVYYCDIYNKISMDKWIEYIIAPNADDRTGAHYTTEGSKFIYNSIKECIASNQ